MNNNYTVMSYRANMSQYKKKHGKKTWGKYIVTLSSVF